MIQKNNLNQQQIQKLKPLINKFIIESGCKLNHELVLGSTIQNIILGLEHKAAHDVWILGDMEGYCLCRTDRDADGQLVYTVYQLWLDPKIRNWMIARDLGVYLQNYARDCGYVRMYAVSSRLDRIRAYARGLGRNFQAQTVTFVTQLIKERKNVESDERTSPAIN